MFSKKSTGFCAAIFSIVLMSCVNLESYYAVPDPMPGAGQAIAPIKEALPDPHCMTADTCTMFVEYDDFGHLYSRHQINTVTRTAEEVASRNGIIVVYVHGWHHTAAKSDDDVDRFKTAIIEAGDMDRKKYGDNRQVMGIYVGWRGESIDKRVTGLLSELTFWDRKNTAHDVGDGAVFELFRKLANFREEHPDSRLVLIGHSFGGALLYSSITHSITAQIIDDFLPEEREVAVTAGKRWDLVLLINPAFEAMLLRPNFALARSREYKPSQLPHLVIVASQADGPNRSLFPIGRHLSTLFKRYPDHDTVSGKMNTTAVGHYIPYITHQLSVSDQMCDMKTVNLRKYETEKELKTVATNHNYCLNDPRAMLNGEARPTWLTRCDKPGQCAQVAGKAHYIQRGAAADGLIPDAFPILNIHTTNDVMSGHTDIWNPTMRAFVTQLLLMSVPPER